MWLIEIGYTNRADESEQESVDAVMMMKHQGGERGGEVRRLNEIDSVV